MKKNFNNANMNNMGDINVSKSKEFETKYFYIFLVI